MFNLFDEKKGLLHPNAAIGNVYLSATFQVNIFVFGVSCFAAPVSAHIDSKYT